MRPRVLWIGAGVVCLAAAWALLRPSPEAAAPAAAAEGEAGGTGEGAEAPFFLHANWDASAKAPAAHRGALRSGTGDARVDEAWERLKGVEFALPAPEEKR